MTTISIAVIPPVKHAYNILMDSHFLLGWLTSMLLLSAPISLVGTYFVSSRFRKAVARSMAAAAETVALQDSHSSEVLTDSGRKNLQLRIVRPRDSRAEMENTLAWQKNIGMKQREVLLVNALAGLTYVFIAGFLYLSKIDAFSAEAVLLLAVAFTPPLTAAIVISSNRSYLVLLLALVFHLAVLEGLLRFFNAEPWSAWFQLIAVPVIALLILSNRRMRAVGPMMYVAVLVGLGCASLGFFFASFYMIEQLGLHFTDPHLAHLPFLDAADQWFKHLMSLSPSQQIETLNSLMSVIAPEHLEHATGWLVTLFLLCLFGFAIVGIFIVWCCLRWLANRYRQHRVSDQMLEIETWWVWFAVVLMIIHGGIISGGWAILWALVSLITYYVVIYFGFHWIQKRRPEEAPVSLLLLRVFGFDKRTQWLLDSLGGKWRFIGPIMLVAGPDVAHSQMEPHEFLDYTTGHLSRQFIRSKVELPQRIRESENGSDPDGRFRIHEFFCHEDTWRFTVTALLGRTNTVLMDLRGFSSANEGCEFEIKELLYLVPLERIMLLVDESTEQKILNERIQDFWSKLPISSINANAKEPQLTLIEVSDRSDAAVDEIFQLLMK